MTLTLPPIMPATPQWQGDTPVSPDYADSYFSPGQGPAESDLVFIKANALQHRFSALKDGTLFVIGETGFGSGLNGLLAARLFLQQAPAGARLHWVSAELHPLVGNDLARALAPWPELATLAEALVTRYPPPVPGCHRIALDERIELTLMLGDATTLWAHFPARVDAWFLDGFAPSRNPAMWQPELFSILAARSRPGATLGTFTAAGPVRRGLAEAGFRVRREPGFGPKRHRLTAIWPGRWQPQRLRRGRVLIAGAGIAGATTARALAGRGWEVCVTDPALAAAPAVPKNLAGVLYATASAHLHAQNRFYQTSLLVSRRWLESLGFPTRDNQGRLEGVVQHLLDERMRDKTLAAIGSAAWPDGMLTRIDEHSVCFHHGGCLQPGAWIARLLDHPRIESLASTIHALAPPSGVVLDQGRRLDFDAVVLCTAAATRQLPDLEWLPLRSVRGQVTLCRATTASARWRRPHCHAGYLTPALSGVHCVGATFDRARHEAIVDPADDRANLADLSAALPERWNELGGARIEVVGRHAGIRCQSPDTLPLVGPLPDPRYRPHRTESDIWLNIAHGSRGLTHTPLCAELVADTLSGHPLPVDSSICRALAPERLVMRRRRKDPDWQPGKS